MSNLKMASIVSVLSRTPNLLKELQTTLPTVAFHQVEQGGVDKDEQFFKSEIIIGDYDFFGPYIYSLPNAKWVQGTWAGVDILLPFVKPDNPPPFPITRFSGSHFGQLIGEYVIANIVNHERRMFEIKENQVKQLWVTDGKITNYRSLFELTIGILGVGNIGDKVARTLNYMGATVLGFGRRNMINLNENRHISQYFNKDNLPQMLQMSDYVVNILPNTSETKGLLNDRILEHCKGKGSVFINVGRGSVISDESLIEALVEKWISAAILDVFNNEPLKKDNPLWKIPNVFITPHVSGMSRAKDLAEKFCENLQLFQQNLPMPATVDFSKGY